MKGNKLTKYIRGTLLALFVILVSIAAYLHQVNGGAVSPSIHALCPFGGLESLYQTFTLGSFISKIFEGTLILFAITMVLALVFRRSFCGLLCPFGAIQEFFGKIGRKVMGRKLIMPAVIDRPLRYLKYVVLLITIAYAWITAGLWMAPYDPWSVYAHLFTNNPIDAIGTAVDESLIGLILLVVVLIGSFLYDRFFCKYLCPMGALYGIIGKLSPYKVVRDENVCISCGKCSKVCPVNIDVQHSKEVKSAECINCQSCVLSCPKAGALTLKEGKKTIKPAVVIVLVAALFFGSILVFQALGMYKLLPDKLAEGESIPVEEIKGYMTIKDASDATKIEIHEFYKEFQIPESVPDSTKMKEIKDIVPDYDYESIKDSLGDTAAPEVTPSEPSSVKVNVEGVTGSVSIRTAASSANISLEEFYKLFKIPENVPANTLMKDIANQVPGYDFHAIKASLE